MRGSAWDAWHSGDFTEARTRAAHAIQHGQEIDEARHVFALSAHVAGAHEDAISAYGAISPRYRRLAELDEPILWSYLRRGDMAAARAFAERRALLKSRATRERLRLAMEKPLGVEISDIVELPFTEDAFSPLMPGVEVRVQGRPFVARLDTGGSYLHVTESQARTIGIPYAGGERSFAGLLTAKTWYGAADLALGEARIWNAPVWVHTDATFRSGVVQSAFGVEMGPIIGTNVFQQFLTTIDSPGRRLILSKRDDPAARAAHLARLSGGAEEVPFALQAEHFMIARGRVGDERDVNFFVARAWRHLQPSKGKQDWLSPRARCRRGASLSLRSAVSRRFPYRSRSGRCVGTV